MVNDTQTAKSISLEQYGIKNAKVNYQLSPSNLHDITIAKGQGVEASSGALAVNTGEFTGRSPLDRFIVKDSITSDKVWWSKINIPFESDAFQKLYNKVVDYLSNKAIFVRDSYVCANSNYKTNIRVINEHPWSNMFAYNMFLRPKDEELETFEPEWLIVNAPGFMAIPNQDGTRQHNFAILDFTRKIALIGGTGYTAKVAGTEAGVIEPVPSFSACFGAPFMPLHPTKYAEMLSKKMKDSGVNVWLINTGWTGGAYGVGTRMKLKYTRAMISAVLNGDLDLYTYDDYHIHSVFGVSQPRFCPGVPTKVLSPKTAWNDDDAYYKTAFKLSNAFRENFKKFEAHATEEIRRGLPQRYAF